MLANKKDNALLKDNVLKFLFLELLCVFLMVMDYHSKIANPVRASLSALTYPLIKLVEWPQEVFNIIKLSVSEQTTLLDENAELKAQLSQARINLLQFEVTQQQNKELRELLQTKEKLPLITTSAFIKNINSGNNPHKVVINQGFNQGVYSGQPVLDLNGVAGQVTKVDLESAHVLLISDPTHAIPVEVLRTGYRTFAYGSDSLESIVLPEMDQTSDIKVNDIIITSGYGDLFPRGLKVGVVNNINETTDGFFLQAEAKITADFRQMKQILLIWSEAPSPNSQ